MKPTYVSRELTHFVGRKDPSQNEQFDRLVSILRMGRLEPVEKNLRDIRRILLGKLSDEVDPCPTATCFCDIPYNFLLLHMDKYSHFGLSFLKPFLVAQGVAPVFYVAKNSVTEYWINPLDERRELLFDQNTSRSELISVLRDELTNLLHPLLIKHDEGQYMTEFELKLLRVFHHLVTDVFAFIRIFNDELEDTDDNNFYMEREWRATKSVNFKLSDVKRIIVPENYVQRLKSAFPDYAGTINGKDAAAHG